jgi:hypothetical protein
MNDEPKIFENIGELAAHFGKTKRTVHNWIRRGLPRRDDGTFDRQTVQNWLDGKQGVAPEPSPGQNDTDRGGGKDWWDKENKKYQARMRELEYRRKAGEYVLWKKVEDEFVARILAVKHALLALERSLPPDLVACRTEREMAVIIRRVIYGILERFARPLPDSLRPAKATKPIDQVDE